MNEETLKNIEIDSKEYNECLSVCDKIAKAAQNHIGWNDEVGCSYIPGKGLCIEIESNVCPVERFFELPKITGNNMISGYTYFINCI